MTAEEKLTALEKILPEHWQIMNRDRALAEIERPDGLIDCFIHHRERGKLITRLPIKTCELFTAILK